jgi:hypothetical protein
VSFEDLEQVSTYFSFVMLKGTVTCTVSPTCHGPFLEDDLFGCQIKPLQLTIYFFLINLINLLFLVYILAMYLQNRQHIGMSIIRL